MIDLPISVRRSIVGRSFRQGHREWFKPRAHRFTAFLRAVMPGLAGTARLPYRRFLAFNAAGGLVWGTGFVILGYLAGASYAKVESYASYAGYLVLAAIVGAVLILHRRRSDRRRDTVPGAEEIGKKPESASHRSSS